MKNLTLEAIVSVCGGQYIGDEKLKKCEIQGAVTDSRQVEAGYLFISVKGERVDGHDFIPQVFEKGALAVLSEKPLKDSKGPYILVESTLKALKDVAAFYRRQLGLPVIGITGSVGKTSTKEMIASVLSVKYQVLKTAGNFNNEIGLPLTILRIRENHEAAVVEMGISDFGEMHRLAEIARPDVCVITNIGACHLENLGDRDGVLRAKTEVFDHLTPGAAVILNGDDDKLSGVEDVKGTKPVFYGKKETNDIFATGIKNLGLKGTKALLHTPQGNVEILVPIPGAHQLSNAMAAAAAGLHLGLSLEQIRQGIAAAQTISGRSNLIEANGLMIIDDCYNANPMSMKASLEVLHYGLGRRVAILGDMGELGLQEKELHYQVGAYAAKVGIDLLVCVGELSAEIERGARENLPAEIERGARGNLAAGTEQRSRESQPEPGILYYPAKEQLLRALPGIIKKGDTILVKASHFMGFSEIVEQLQK